MVSADRAAIRFTAIGDSFTEGVGDELADGSVRGWADLVAQGIAEARGEAIQYANFAIRGRLLAGILEEQLAPALALEPTILSINGGGNDMLRPGTDLPWIISELERALREVLASGSVPLLLAGANPTIGIPHGSAVQHKGDELTAAATAMAGRLGVPICDNWSDPILARREYWCPDRLHLSPIGHHRVAANVLRTLGYTVPSHWIIDAAPIPAPTRLEELRYTRDHVLPWLRRRLTGRSSGDGRSAKHPSYVWVAPPAPTAPATHPSE